MTRKGWIVARTPEELAKALDLSPADAQEWRFRRELSVRIAHEVARQKLTHAAAAKLAGTSRSRMTAIVNGSSLDASTDLLLRILASLGVRVKPTFSRAA